MQLPYNIALIAVALAVGMTFACSPESQTVAEENVSTEKQERKAKTAAMLKKLCKQMPNHIGPPMDCGD